MSDIQNPISFEEADRKARVFVCGMHRDPKLGMVVTSGHWHKRFMDHPWVRQSIAEDWARELRSVVISNVARRIRTRLPHENITDLMPDQQWVDCVRTQAKRYSDGMESRQRLIAEYGSLEAALAKINRQPKEGQAAADTLGDALSDLGLHPDDYAHLVKRPARDSQSMRPLSDISRAAFERRYSERNERLRKSREISDRITGDGS